MNTEDLIRGLGHELRPVRRLRPPGLRAAVWLGCGVAYVLAMGTVAWIRGGPLGVEAAGPYWLQQGTLALASIVAAAAAFSSVVPGAKNPARSVLAVPIVLMMAALAWGLLRDMQQHGTVGIGLETDWPCVASTSLGGLALWVVATAMLRRGAVLEPRATSALAGMAALSLANVEACFNRAHAFTATVVAWHGATIAVVMLGLIAFGPRLLRRQSGPIMR